MLAQKALAERVDRAYLRLGAQGALTAQTAVVGIGSQALGDLVEYAAFKLRGGCLGEGDDKEAVDIRVTLYAAQEALGQNSRLAASGRRRDEHRPPRFLYRTFLCARRLKFRHRSRLPPKRSTPSSREGAALFSCSRRFRRRGSGMRRNSRSLCTPSPADRSSTGRPRCCLP